MKIFITGGSGFVGQQLLNTLSNNSSIQLFSLFRKKKDENLKKINIQPVYGNLFSLKNISLDGIDVVIHIAGVTKSLFPQKYFTINTKGTIEIINFAKKEKAKQIIFISSLSAYGASNSTEPVKESSIPKPVSNYGLSKLIAEKFIKKSGIPYTIIRPPAVFGPGDKDIFTYFKMVKQGIALTSGNPNKLYSLIYVKDLAESIKKTILNEKAMNNDFFFSNKEFYKIDDIIKSIEKSFNKTAFKINLPEFFAKSVFYSAQVFYVLTTVPPLLNLDKLKEIEQNNWICSSEKAYSLLNFEPEYNLDNAIKETTKWYLENNWL